MVGIQLTSFSVVAWETLPEARIYPRQGRDRRTAEPVLDHRLQVRDQRRDDPVPRAPAARRRRDGAVFGASDCGGRRRGVQTSRRRAADAGAL